MEFDSLQSLNTAGHTAAGVIFSLRRAIERHEKDIAAKPSALPADLSELERLKSLLATQQDIADGIEALWREAKQASGGYSAGQLKF